MRKGRLLLSLFLLLGGCASIPPRPDAVQVSLPPGYTYHTVEKGQTLWRIAHEHGVDVRVLADANGITDAGRIEAGRRLLIPAPPMPPATVPVAPGPAVPGLSYSEIERLVGSFSGRIRWRTITIHHSATRYGNGKVFDRYHKRRGMGGLFYHFLIGNGNGLGDGRIEVGWRWKSQSEVNRPQDIQICLIGNFERQQVTERQYEALERLITVLRRRYGLKGTGCVRRHCDVAVKPTECPGKFFPYSRLISDLRSGN